MPEDHPRAVGVLLDGRNLAGHRKLSVGILEVPGRGRIHQPGRTGSGHRMNRHFRPSVARDSSVAAYLRTSEATRIEVVGFIRGDPSLGHERVDGTLERRPIGLDASVALSHVVGREGRHARPERVPRRSGLIAGIRYVHPRRAKSAAGVADLIPRQSAHAVRVTIDVKTWRQWYTLSEPSLEGAPDPVEHRVVDTVI